MYHGRGDIFIGAWLSETWMESTTHGDVCRLRHGFSASSHAETTKRCHWSSNEAIYNEMAANSKIEFSRIIWDWDSLSLSPAPSIHVPVGCDEHFGTCFLEFWGSTLCRRHCLSDVDSKALPFALQLLTLGHRQGFRRRAHSFNWRMGSWLLGFQPSQLWPRSAWWSKCVLLNPGIQGQTPNSRDQNGQTSSTK